MPPSRWHRDEEHLASSIGKAAGDRCTRLQRSEEAVVQIQLSASRAVAVLLCDTVDGERHGGRGFTLFRLF
jgi:hypothetical protein